MSAEQQALETEQEILIDEGQEAAIPESDEVEIVLEGDDQPTSEAVPLGTFLKTKKKLQGKVAAKSQEVDERDRTIEALREENKLYRMKTEQAVLKRPKVEDFDSDTDEYEKAIDSYYDQRADQIAEKKLSEKLAQSTVQTTQRARDDSLDANLKAHYERAGKLKIKDFGEREEAVIDVLGPDVYQFIVNNTDNSELILGHFIAKPENAEALVQKIASNPSRGAVEIGRLSSKLSVKPKTLTAPDPEEKVQSGGGKSTKLSGAKFY